MLNFFQRNSDPVVYCVLPDGGALPAFLTNAEWSFAGKVLSARNVPAGLDLSRLASTARRNGYVMLTGEICDGPFVSTAHARGDSNLDDILAEPIVRLLMARDGVEEHEVRRLLDSARRRWWRSQDHRRH